MFYSINTNAASQVAKRYVDDHSANAGETMNKVSKGERHTKPSTDPSGLVVSNTMRTTIAALKEGQRNTSQASTLLQIAAHGLQETISQISRMRQLAVQTVNDTLSVRDRALANEEYQNLIAQLDTTAHYTRFNGRSLLAGGVASVQTRNANSTAILNPVTESLPATELNGAIDSTYFTAATTLNTDDSTGNFTLTLDDPADITVAADGNGTYMVLLTDGNQTFYASQTNPGQDESLVLTEVGNRSNVIVLDYNVGAGAPATAADFKTDIETLFDVNGAGSTLTMASRNRGFTGEIDPSATQGFVHHDFRSLHEIEISAENGIVSVNIGGEIFTGSTLAKPNGRLTLQSTEIEENFISFIYADDVSHISTDKAFASVLREMFAEGSLSVGVQAALTGVTNITDATTISAFNTFRPLNTQYSAGTVVGQIESADDIRVAESPLGNGSYTVEILLSGETFRATDVLVEDNGVLTLVSTANSGNIMSFNYSRSTLDIGDAATFKAQLEGFLTVGVANTEPATFAIGDPKKAFGLDTNQTVFGAELNSVYSRGLIEGVTKSSSVVSKGEAYDVSLTVGNQTFQALSYVPANGVLTLVSEKDPNNVIAFDVLDASQLNTESSFERFLGDFVGTSKTAEVNPARFKSDNGFNHNHNGFRMGFDTSISSSSTTPPGIYGFSYDASTRSFHIGGEEHFNTISYKDLNHNETGQLSFQLDNGLTLQIGNSRQAFDPEVSISHSVFEITSNDIAEISLQISNEIEDELGFFLPPATASALGLTGTNITSKFDARNAEDLLSKALDTVSIGLASISASQARLETLRTNSIQLIEKNIALRGFYNDIDMGEEITNFTTHQTLTQASVSMLTQANSIPETLLRLLP